MRGRDIETVLDINALVHERADDTSTAAAVLGRLTAMIPYSAASLQLWDPFADRHRTIANHGYSVEQTEHLDTWFVGHDEAYRYMRDVDAAPLRWADMPFDYATGFSALRHWLPAGYKEGVTTCLFAADGSYTGNLHLNTDSIHYPSDAGMGGLAALQRILGDFTDARREPARLVSAVDPQVHGAVIGSDGRLHELPGRSPGPWLVGGSQLVASLRCLPRASAPWRGWWCDPSGGWHEVTLGRTAVGRVVTQRAAPLPFGLTRREVEVLDLLTTAATNRDIARRLGISVKTAVKHVEHVMQKTGCRSRTAAAVLAVEEGVRLLRSPDGR